MSNWEQWAKWVKGTTSDALVQIRQLGAGLALEVLGPFGLRSTGAAFNLLIRSVEVFTASRTLTVGLNNADRTLTVAGDATISGTNTGDQTITLTGDVTGSGAGSFATTLATVNAGPGSYTNASVTVNAKGLVTAAASGVATGMVLLGTVTASGSASADFTANIDGTYASYRVVFAGVRPASDDQQLRVRMGAGSFDSGANYYYAGRGMASNGVTRDINGAAATFVGLTPVGAGSELAVGNASTESAGGWFDFTVPATSALNKTVAFHLAYAEPVGPRRSFMAGGGGYVNAVAVDRVQFFFASGNIAEGVFMLYGMDG